MANQVLLEARGIRRSYGRVTVLQNVDLVLGQGEILGFLGLNGAGKSTTIQILAGALSADAGSVAVCGHDLVRARRRACRNLGYAPQRPPLYDDMSVAEFLTFRGRCHGLRGAALRQAVAKTCAECGLGDATMRLIGHLSPGYQQRIGIAQALVHEPRVVLLDEPTSGLDPKQIRDVRELITAIGKTRSVLLSTHLLSEVRQLATRIAILHDGGIIYDAANRSRGELLRVRFAAQLDLRTLAGISGVRDVHALEDGAWLIALDDSVMDVTRFATFVTASGWGLCELIPDHDALEQLFVQLTCGDQQ